MMSGDRNLSMEPQISTAAAARSWLRSCGGRIGRGIATWLATEPRLKIAIEPVFWVMGLRRRKGAFSLQKCARVLVIRLDGRGDVILTSPLLRELRRNLPKAWISLVVDRQFTNLVEECPYIDEVLGIDIVRPEFALGFYGCRTFVASRFERYRRALQFAKARLWQQRYDLALAPRWGEDYEDQTLLAYCSGAKWRIGYAETVSPVKALLNHLQDHLLTQALPSVGVRHEVERNLDLIRLMGGTVEKSSLEVWWGSGDQDFANDLFQSRGVTETAPLIALCPGAATADRIWPWRRYAEVARWLAVEYDARIVLLGGPSDVAAGAQIAEIVGDGAIDLTGRTTVRQAAAVLSRCRIYVGNDTGPMHMAAAAGVPVVEVSCHSRSGSADHNHSPIRYGPWGVPNRVLQPDALRQPCTESCGAETAHCILDVSVEMVKDAILELIPEMSRRRMVLNSEPVLSSGERL